jgi:SAP domain-containing new25
LGSAYRGSIHPEGMMTLEPAHGVAHRTVAMHTGHGNGIGTNMGKKTKLSKFMTEAEFDNGYWYATELKKLAVKVGIPSANKLRKDELEKALKHFIRTGEAKSFVKRSRAKPGARDVDAGLSLDLPIVNYASNRQTKAFIEREATKLEPQFKRASGTCYLLNRWREDQLATGKRITYRDLVTQAIELNKTKHGPLRVEHGRYMNFISDFMAANKKDSLEEAVKAWKELKAMNAPKTYEFWAKRRSRRR